ncbi:MAG TPA: hypothetical protein VE544_00840 [Nitrososphaeraceae archaeon]|nr:hypothetical protein [Nitrososphaeraceae archaeon]
MDASSVNIYIKGTMDGRGGGGNFLNKLNKAGFPLANLVGLLLA